MCIGGCVRFGFLSSTVISKCFSSDVKRTLARLKLLFSLLMLGMHVTQTPDSSSMRVSLWTSQMRRHPHLAQWSVHNLCLFIHCLSTQRCPTESFVPFGQCFMYSSNHSLKSIILLSASRFVYCSLKLYLPYDN